jgi:hypothetical protein
MPDEKKPDEDRKPVDQFLAESLDIMIAAGWVEKYGGASGNTAVQYTEHGEKALEALWRFFGELFPHGLTKDTWWGAAFVATLKFGPPKE